MNRRVYICLFLMMNLLFAGIDITLGGIFLLMWPAWLYFNWKRLD